METPATDSKTTAIGQDAIESSDDMLVSSHLRMREELAFFKSRNPVLANSNRPVGTRERNTLLTIIAALSSEAKIDYRTPAKAANLICSAAAGLGVSLGETTVEGYLKRVPAALEAKTK